MTGYLGIVNSLSPDTSGGTGSISLCDLITPWMSLHSAAMVTVGGISWLSVQVSHRGSHTVWAVGITCPHPLWSYVGLQPCIEVLCWSTIS